MMSIKSACFGQMAPDIRKFYTLCFISKMPLRFLWLSSKSIHLFIFILNVHRGCFMVLVFWYVYLKNERSDRIFINNVSIALSSPLLNNILVFRFQPTFEKYKCVSSLSYLFRMSPGGDWQEKRRQHHRAFLHLASLSYLHTYLFWTFMKYNKLKIILMRILLRKSVFNKQTNS